MSVSSKSTTGLDALEAGGSAKGTGIVYNANLELHEAKKSHPERPARIRSIREELVKQHLLERCVQVNTRAATIQEVLTAHSQKHVDEVQNSTQKCIEREGANIFWGNDTYANEHSSTCAHLAVGGLIELINKVVQGELKNGFAVIRPPGHHAESDKIMGFCLYNNVAIAAKVIQQTTETKKILIVDWDVHHGNGTQQIFEDDNTVLYFSVHRYDNGKFYPGTGHANSCGTGKGEGFSVNVPWNDIGMGDHEYLLCWKHILLPIINEFQPDLILVSAGFDAAQGDPIGKMQLTPTGYAHLTEQLCKFANGKVVLALEGGYELSAISQSAAACVKVLLGEKPDILPEKVLQIDQQNQDNTSLSAMQTIQAVQRIQSKYWKCFSKVDSDLESLIQTFEANLQLNAKT